MNKKKITNDIIANAVIELNYNLGVCDADTAKGFKTSKKKEILKSSDDHSFARFISEIKKRQTKKNGGNQI